MITAIKQASLVLDNLLNNHSPYLNDDLANTLNLKKTITLTQQTEDFDLTPI